jgi:tetratricopeptide (TPR) repeat protein
MAQKSSAAAVRQEADVLKQGEAYERQNDYERAAETYQQGLADFPAEIEFHRRLGYVYLNKNSKEEALKHFSRFVEAGGEADLETAEIYGSLLEELKDKKEALAYYKKVNRKLESQDIDYMIQRLKSGGKVGEDSEPERIKLKYSASTVADVFSFFSGRENNYAMQWSKEDTTGYSPANEPLSFQKVARHLEGEITLGIYQLNTASQVKWCAFDVDIKKDEVTAREDAGKNINFLLFQALTVARELRRVVSSRGLKAYLEFSGFKGYHVWIFFAEFVSAQKAKALMEDMLKQADFGVLDKVISVEIFPKQEKLADTGKLGNLVKLPFGIHKKTGRRSYFLDDDDQPVPEPADFFEVAEKNTVAQFQKSHEGRDTGAEEQEPVETDGIVKDSSITFALSHPEFNLLLSKCRILDFIVNKIVWEKECTDDEFTIVKHTVGHLKDGQKLVNLRTINDDLKLKKPLTGYPMGCKKIKQRVPDIAARFDCDCVFSTDLKEYKHPVLHIREFDLEQEQMSQQRVEAVKFQQHLEKYLETRKEIKEKVAFVKQLEKYLNKYLDDKNVEELKTEFGVLRRVTHPNGETVLMMEL